MDRCKAPRSGKAEAVTAPKVHTAGEPQKVRHHHFVVLLALPYDEGSMSAGAWNVVVRMLPQVPGYYVAYCGNIAFDATAAELEEVFADCGVTQVRSRPCCTVLLRHHRAMTHKLYNVCSYLCKVLDNQYASGVRRCGFILTRRQGGRRGMRTYTFPTRHRWRRQWL